MLNICWVIDDDTRRQGRDGDLVGIESDLPLTLNEPVEELVPGLEEPNPVAGERQCARRPPIVWSAATTLDHYGCLR